jgi:hypothetical protein
MMEERENERRELLAEKRNIEIASLRRLLKNHDEFFNFVNLNDGWYRWVTGKYSVNSIDSMGESLIEYLCRFCKEHDVTNRGDMSSDRILALDYKGVQFLFRKLDGKDDFSAVSLVEMTHNFRVISWDKLNSYLETELRKLLADEVENETVKTVLDKTYIKE